MANQYPYRVHLTAEEYRSAAYMADRGYLGELTAKASVQNWADDEQSVDLLFTEPDAWAVLEVCEADQHAVWALTSTRTELGRKFQQFLDRIV
jgi:hypothetical protein